MSLYSFQASTINFIKDWQGSLPYLVLVDAEGKVLYKVDGTINPLEVKRAIVGSLGRYYADN